MAVVSAWRRVRAALTELNKCAWLPEPTAVTGRPLQREKPADPTRSPALRRSTAADRRHLPRRATSASHRLISPQPFLVLRDKKSQVV
ncbi:Uncharacterised protein [Mycobacteroides abscessus subsp. abscessus]|nr:Uncharacterised protein [Mycobacteroides abscessus subsp. abscessus]